jgi:cell division protein ZapA
MADQQTVTISIFDKDYKISCDQEEVQALRDSAHYLDKKMREVKSSRTVMGLDRIAVMAALNITNELLQKAHQNHTLQDEQGSASSRLAEAETRLSALIEQLKHRSA